MKRRSPTGTLIVLEGIDGAGKSTLQRGLASLWRQRGWPVVVAREPSDTALAASAERAAHRPMEAALYFTLDRARSSVGTQQMLAEGKIVLQDRSFYSTLAYQGSELSPEWRSWLAALQRGIAPEPARVVWLDLPVAAALARLPGRGGRRSSFEVAQGLRRVRREYARLARPPRWIRVKADVPAAQLVREVDRRLRAAVDPSRRRLHPRTSFKRSTHRPR
ncbi:MAG: dTMP kinase [Thermoplasmata archaeon]|nr:dTMP kinase [Thermoplasmata archaeon]